MLPYVGFFPCEIMFQPLADDLFFFGCFRNYKLKLKASEREVRLKIKRPNRVSLIINCPLKNLSLPVPSVPIIFIKL